MISAAIGGLVFVAVIVVFIVVGVQALGAKGEMDALEQAIASNNVPELAEWNPSLLGWLSCDVVGSTFYRRPMGGARTHELAIVVPSWQGPATLLALSAKLTQRRGEGQIAVLARNQSGNWRVDLVLHAGVWQVSVNGRALGAIDEASGRIDDPQRVPLGWRHRSSAGVQLSLRGADVAWICPDATLHAQRPEHRRPLLRVAAPLTEVEPVMWVLAAVGLELGQVLMEHGRV